MGLFRKKPKSIIVPRPAVASKPAADASPGEKAASGDPDAPFKPELAAKATPTPAPPKPTATAAPSKPTIPAATHTKPDAGLRPPQLPPLPPKPSKKQNKKARVDPADFLALRSEMMHLRARLDESEHARALVEARLAALDASTAAFSSERTELSEVANMVIQLQQEISARPVGAVVTGETPVAYTDHDELSAKVDALHNRIFGLQDHGPKIAEFEAQLNLMRAELNAATYDAQPAAPSIDPQVFEHLAAVYQRLDQLENAPGTDLSEVEQRLASVDGLAAQLQQLNARVAAQAELGGQLSALRDRINQLSDEQPVATDGHDELHTQVNELGERLSSYDNEARAVREHMAALDQRLTNVSTELANQISELGRDIDGLGQRIPEVLDGVVSDEVVDALRGGQVKLANEQARYEIAFRQDLAALAEQLRRGAS